MERIDEDKELIESMILEKYDVKSEDLDSFSVPDIFQRYYCRHALVMPKSLRILNKNDY